MVTGVFGVPMVGLNPEMVGELPPFTMNDVLLVAEPVGVVIAIGPVLVPDCTVATICVEVADVTLAATPLKVTKFWLGMVLNPVP